MSQTITAIYADGVLRPLTPLKLPEQTEVVIEVRGIKRPDLDPSDERVRVYYAMVAAGSLANWDTWSTTSAEPPISDEEQEKLGLLFAEGKPLSEIIIEERQEGW